MWRIIRVLFGGVRGFLLRVPLIRRRKNRTALIDAILKNELEKIQRILADGIDLNFNFWSGASWISIGSPLSAAFFANRRPVIDLLIENGSSLSSNSPGNDSLLVKAARNRNYELIDMALAAGHDIHFRPDRSSTPLETAVHRSATETARYLISKGATKEDLRGCRWHATRAPMILLLVELGVDVPRDVVNAVKNGDWDSLSAPKTPEIGGVGG